MVSPWRKALACGTLTAAGLGVLGAAIVGYGSSLTDLGWIVLFYLPLPIALVVAYFIHAVNAIMLSSVLTLLAWFPVAVSKGAEVMFAPVLVPWITLPCLVGGALAGAMLRIFVRKWRLALAAGNEYED
jgi:hypothetical protein